MARVVQSKLGWLITYINTRLIFLFAYCVWATSLHAASDRSLSAPFIIDANQAVADNLKKTVLFEGRVSLQRGDILLKGDSATLKELNKNHRTLLVTGSPVIFQKNNHSNEYTNGSADTVSYDDVTEKLILKGNAYIKHSDGSELRGDLIEVNLKTSVYRASCDKSCVSDANQRGRIRLIISPKESPTAIPLSNSANLALDSNEKTLSNRITAPSSLQPSKFE